ncbi:hypothetical protein KL86CLO1_11691 [uncultured Eubacteriales bacterium]|uniref:Uncharacterized protein n=1 Tax=uncultured Eubacteriales bacterium TaxID=172733 RepID=A0A212JTG2_9FIRM|nr:hypothetical protein KL86CLO1_11691 [uncultured Eubacteriales bacterium]
MNDNQLSILTIIVSGIAVLISLFSAWISRRSIITNAISSNRIEWIAIVRNLIRDFVKEYSGGSNIPVLTNIYSELVLYFNPNGEVYAGLVNAMKKAILEGYTAQNHWNILNCGQAVLDSSWKRMKRESGMSFKTELKISKSFVKERKMSGEGKPPKWTIEIV